VKKQTDITDVCLVDAPAPETARTRTDGNAEAPGQVETHEFEIDGKTIVLNAAHTITLRCGQASITLNRDGKIVIRGTHVVSHASGVNRIRGGSVELN
jgi:hypothetical protein